MDWLEESRRMGFEGSKRVRAQERQDTPDVLVAVDEFLPGEIRTRALVIGNELIIPYDDALVAVRTATANSIAVLGLEAGEVLDDGFRVVDYSAYEGEVMLKPDWNAYVSAMNNKATAWITTHRFGKNHGYILTSTTEQGFYALAGKQPKGL